jgi:hypothetical protein
MSKKLQNHSHVTAKTMFSSVAAVAFLSLFCAGALSAQPTVIFENVPARKDGYVVVAHLDSRVGTPDILEKGTPDDDELRINLPKNQMPSWDLALKQFSTKSTSVQFELYDQEKDELGTLGPRVVGPVRATCVKSLTAPFVDHLLIDLDNLVCEGKWGEHTVQ